MKIFFYLRLLLLFLLPSSSYSQELRSTSFDDRPTCESAKGVWRQFGNSCVDECRPKLDSFSVCAQAITYGCDCGKGRCWDGETCVMLKDYKKIFDIEKEEEEKILAEARKQRQEAAKANEKFIMNGLINKTATTEGQSVSNANQANNNSVVAAEKAVPEAPPIVIDTGNVKIPEMFLRQEKEKQAEVDKKNQTKEKDQKENSAPILTLPGLPVIPLP
jgi:hypothetical protein